MSTKNTPRVSFTILEKQITQMLRFKATVNKKVFILYAVIGWQLPWVVDGKDWIEYTVLDFDAGEGWTMVDDTATFSDGSSTNEVFSMLDATMWMDGRITLSKNRKGIICDKEAIRRTQQI